MGGLTAAKVKNDGEVMVVIFGGDDNKNGVIYTFNLEMYNVGTIDKVSYQRLSHSNSTMNNQVYLFGGKWKNEYHNDMQKFDIDTETLETLQTTGEPPSPRYKHSSAVVGKMMYVFGGARWGPKEYYADLHCFNPLTKEWTTLQTGEKNPSPRSGMSFFGFQE